MTIVEFVRGHDQDKAEQGDLASDRAIKVAGAITRVFFVDRTLRRIIGLFDLEQYNTHLHCTTSNFTSANIVVAA